MKSQIFLQSSKLTTPYDLEFTQNFIEEFREVILRKANQKYLKKLDLYIKWFEELIQELEQKSIIKIRLNTTTSMTGSTQGPIKIHKIKFLANEDNSQPLSKVFEWQSYIPILIANKFLLFFLHFQIINQKSNLNMQHQCNSSNILVNQEGLFFTKDVILQQIKNLGMLLLNIYKVNDAQMIEGFLLKLMWKLIVNTVNHHLRIYLGQNKKKCQTFMYPILKHNKQSHRINPYMILILVYIFYLLGKQKITNTVCRTNTNPKQNNLDLVILDYDLQLQIKSFSTKIIQSNIQNQQDELINTQNYVNYSHNYNTYLIVVTILILKGINIIQYYYFRKYQATNKEKKVSYIFQILIPAIL
ncbi:hypothetical protein pb186bvf_007617 [Paramecium bursaria]